MAEKYLGRAAVWGHSATIAGKTPSGCLGTILIQTIKFKPSADSADLMENVGTVGRVVANRKETLTIEGPFASATSVADAKTQANTTPDIGDVVTVTDSIDTEIAGDWVITDVEKSEDVKAPKSISLTMDRFPDAGGFVNVIS